MESSRTALDINHDLLASFIDHYLPLEAKGRLACVNKRLREGVAKHPLMYLARYIHAFKTQAPLPSPERLEGTRVSRINKELAIKIARNDPGFRGYHQFLSEKHDFEANPTLEPFVECLLRDMRWVVSSLARTAQNSKVRQIAENHQRAFTLLSQPAFNQQEVNAIDWSNLYDGGCLINSYCQLKNLEWKVYDKFKDQPNVATFYGNKNFALFLLHKSHKAYNTSAVLETMFREFPEMTERDYTALMTSCPHLFLDNHNFDAQIPFMRAVRKKHIEIVNLILPGKEEPKQEIPRAQTPLELLQSLPLYDHYAEFQKNYAYNVPFENNAEVALGLAKKFSYYELSIHSPLWEDQRFLISFARIKLFRVPAALRNDVSFLNELIAANPKMIQQFLQGENALYEQAVKSDPWIYSKFTEVRQKTFRALFTSLIPPHTLCAEGSRNQHSV